MSRASLSSSGLLSSYGRFEESGLIGVWLDCLPVSLLVRHGEAASATGVGLRRCRCLRGVLVMRHGQLTTKAQPRHTYSKETTAEAGGVSLTGNTGRAQGGKENARILKQGRMQGDWTGLLMDHI